MSSPTQLQSKYSRIFLREKPSWTAESNVSKVSSSVEPASTTSPGFSYPPSSSLSHASHFPNPMASPAPHPYTLGATRSPVESEFGMQQIQRVGQSTGGQGHGQQNTTETSYFSNKSEKPADSNHNIGHEYPRNGPVTQLAPQDTRNSEPLVPTPLHRRPLLALLLFLPIPPLLSLLYLVTGHAIFRDTHASPDSIFRAPLLSSVEAGATGGVILALPIALLLYILLFPSHPSTAPEDFFEDDSSSVMNQARWIRYTGYGVAALLATCIGGIAGPLGVTCLSGNATDSFVGNKKLLSTGAAASAGFIGGVLLFLGGAAFASISILLWSLWMRRRALDASMDVF
ncbi:hypothetical protein D9613_001753 [Agrocybe pediades]|uniref:Uncharacterized protein n=1 Tax=Agrocybe pediades TaxID=84607 RepID=A0A8H4VXI1_9AGAR|nr:hypothetical protein D9613_001753 [Agrocybe pediades]